MQCEAATATPSDEELARRAQQGCIAGFEELVRRFQVPLMRFFLQRTSAADAEDLLQETFVRAYKSLQRYHAQWRFRTWLFTIARRLSINHYRRRRYTEYENLDLVQCEVPSPAQQAAEADSRRRLWELAAEVLTESQMTAVWLYYVEEMSVGEIAQVQGRSQPAVKTTLFRARQKLLSALESLDPAGSAGGDNPQSNSTSWSKAAEVSHG